MTTWIISTDSHIQGLIDLARALGGQVILVDAGCGPLAGVDRTVTVTDGAGPAEAAVPAVIKAVQAEPGDLALARNGPAERVLAGALAAALDAPVLTDPRELTAESTLVGRFGGIALERVTTGKVRVVIAEGGAEAGPGGTAQAVAVEDRAAMRVIATGRHPTGAADLASSRRIVAVGMGFRAEPDLSLARELASAIGADLACSRPIAEGKGWMPRESYIGVTGLRVSPELYVALGISGQLQHLAGVRDAKTIIAINSDASAPIFAASDYGLVGDLYQALPALANQFAGD
ncbi:MAG: electron transfer flavoprotein subunit alpha/FixB family protein [Bifidobacteriaceae bacterium]|jgi:electron transfer flavoprotein alpha subunit|nr:electron transfer flavoprotein subunit alpha/FixB family protein [Bifidobacteriaceae bacterium]